MQVEVKLSDEDIERIIDGVAERLKQAGKSPKRQKTQAAALCAFETARYLGMSRARYYEVLKADHELAAGCITIGSKRLWPIAFLDTWLAGKQGHHVVPRLTRRPPDGQPS